MDIFGTLKLKTHLWNCTSMIDIFSIILNKDIKEQCRTVDTCQNLLTRYCNCCLLVLCERVQELQRATVCLQSALKQKKCALKLC